MTKKKRILLWLLAAAVLLGCGTGIWAYRSAVRCREELSVAHYTVQTPLTAPIRIVHLSDLHGWRFGENNTRLVELVAQQQPDLILMTGDMLDTSDENADTVCALIEALTEFAPVYYGYGNHEYDWMKRTGESLTPALTGAGATVLDVDYADITINGQALRLGGYHGYYRQPGMFQVTEQQRAAELDFAVQFETTSRYKILLCHIPTAWLDWEYMDNYPVDLVLTGHYHGGQVRLPLIGGLYAPYVGLFPRYTRGIYDGEKATCVLSAGLGASSGIPRINNLPQVVVVDLRPDT